MSQITHIVDEINLIEGFFDEDDDIVSCWPLNSAEWVADEMDDLLENLGHTVVRSKNPSQRMLKELRKHCGIFDDDD